MQLKESSKVNRVGEVENFLASVHRDPTQKLMQRRARVAGQLSALLASLELSHAKVVQKSGIKPSQLSRQLSGDSNLTLDTISRICEAAGADFDLVFRRQGEAASPQWWEAQSRPKLSALLGSMISIGAEQRSALQQFSKSLSNIDGKSGMVEDQADGYAANDESQLIAA